MIEMQMRWHHRHRQVRQARDDAGDVACARAGIEQQRPSSTENEIRVISLVVTWLTERVRVRVDVCTAQ